VNSEEKVISGQAKGKEPLDNRVMIEVKNLTKKFNGFAAVDQISFEVKKSEIFGLLGPNGAGKSTTIRMLTTLIRPNEGTAKIGGYDVIKQDSKVRQLIGLVSEKMIMYDRLTAKENLKFFGKLYNMPDEVLNSKIDELLEMVNLSKWENSKVGTFSTGMRQRMNVVRALLNTPQVLFLDEPTLGLDPQSTVEIREFIRKLNREHKTTIILTTHMMNEADLLCDRIGIIDQGKIVSLDTSANLKKIISGDGTTILKLEIPNLTSNLLNTIQSVKCVSSVSQENSSHITVHATGDDAFDLIIDAVRSQKAKINSIEKLEPTLEDVFLKITGREVRDKADNKIVMKHGPGPKRFNQKQRVR